MKFTTPTGSQTPCRLYVLGILVCTIRERKTGNFRFHFSQKIPIIKYNGGFKSLKSAKLHAKKSLRNFASAILSSNTKKNL